MTNRRQRKKSPKPPKQGGDATRFSVGWVGSSVVLLILTGLICSVLNPANFEKVWLVLSPLITAGLFRLLTPQAPPAGK